MRNCKRTQHNTKAIAHSQVMKRDEKTEDTLWLIGFIPVLSLFAITYALFSPFIE